MGGLGNPGRFLFNYLIGVGFELLDLLIIASLLFTKAITKVGETIY